MSDKEKTYKEINQETKIVFTLKSFIATILSILGMFVGFHKLVIQPKFDELMDSNKIVNEKIDKNIKDVNTQLMEINSGIGVLNGSIDGINKRFTDLNTARVANPTAGQLNGE